jgi:large subunit ribosomal protein L15
MPLQRRLPKRGFSNYHFRKKVQIINIESIAKLSVAKVDTQLLVDKGVIKNAGIPVKVLGDGVLESAVEVTAAAFSKTAIDKIEKAGGKAIVQC